LIFSDRLKLLVGPDAAEIVIGLISPLEKLMKALTLEVRLPAAATQRVFGLQAWVEGGGEWTWWCCE
jgi:hypothetical protein